MSAANQDGSFLSRLLRVKRRRVAGPVPPATSSIPSVQTLRTPVNCINCGYNLAGQTVDRCPECGLVLALQYRDPSPWACEKPGAREWFATAQAVWYLDRRIRVRTALVPTTPATRRFACWSIAAATPMAAGAIALGCTSPGQTAAQATGLFLASLLVGAVLVAVLLSLAAWSASFAVTGRWFRFAFVPASIHYATAWWPLASAAIFAVALGALVIPAAEASLLMSFTIAAGFLAWAMWLASSVSESRRVAFIGFRILIVTAVFATSSTGLALASAWTVRVTTSRAISAAGSGLAALRTLGTFGAASVTAAPRAKALVIDAIRGGDDGLAMEGIRQLGVADADCVVLRESYCTLDNIRKVFAVARNDLRPQDSLIVYINGHGAKDGSGSIRMEDGELTSQDLADYLKPLKAWRQFVVIDSCFAGKYLRQLDDVHALVLTATDDDNIAFATGLAFFWHALGDPQYDQNHDGKTAVGEAFWGAYRKMLSRSEKMRQLTTQTTNNVHLYRILRDNGQATPQLRPFGGATEEDFAVPNRVEKKAPATAPATRPADTQPTPRSQ